VMEATSFRLGGAGQAHASEPNSYWMSFPFAVAAVWAATRARPVCWFRREGIRRHNRFLQELRRSSRCRRRRWRRAFRRCTFSSPT
jgi:hypothetical protein